MAVASLTDKESAISLSVMGISALMKKVAFLNK
jgi:hypothetical protein